MERRALVQGTMDPRLIIVGGICAQNPAQVRLTEYDHVVQALPADRADEPLNVSVLPGRSERNRPISNAHGAETLHEDGSIRGVPIPNEVSRRMVHGKASVIWREIHSAVGFSVTPNDTQSRRPCRMMTRQ